MEVLCGGCGKTLTVEESFAGGEIHCPHCGRVIRVPAMDDPAAPADEQELLTPLTPEDEFANEFVTKARLALKKRLLLACGACGQRLTVKQSLAGRTARCPVCGGQIHIPAPSIYEQPEELEKLGPHAEDPTEVLDLGGSASPASEVHGAPAEVIAEAASGAEAGASPPAAPAVARPPVARTVPRRILRRKPPRRRAKRVVILAAFVLLAVGLAWLGGTIVGLVRQRPGTGQPQHPPGEGHAEVPEPRRPASPPARPAPAPKPAWTQGTSPDDTQPPPTAVVRAGALRVLAAELAVLGGDGFVPAPLGKAFLTVDVRISAGPEPVKLDTAGRAIALRTRDGDTRPLGLPAAEGLIPTPARAGTIVVPANATREASLVFLVPEAFTRGTLQIAGLGEVELAMLPILHLSPAGDVVGEWAEAGRYLKLGFDDPVMEHVRTAPKLKLIVAAAGQSFTLALLPMSLHGQARFIGDGTYAFAVNSGSRSLTWHLRLAAQGKRLILYLADKPYHQVVFQRQ